MNDFCKTHVRGQSTARLRDRREYLMARGTKKPLTPGLLEELERVAFELRRRSQAGTLAAPIGTTGQTGLGE